MAPEFPRTWQVLQEGDWISFGSVAVVSSFKVSAESMLHCRCEDANSRVWGNAAGVSCAKPASATAPFLASMSKKRCMSLMTSSKSSKTFPLQL